MDKRVAIYVRVSTDKQTIENQLRELRQIAERRGWEVVREYHDAGISGAKSREARPGLDEMLKDAQRRRFDVVMAWVIDRLDPLLNRPAGYDPSVGGMRPAIEERIHAQLRSKKGMLAIARDLKVRTGTLQRVKREMEAAGPFEGAAAA